jgi:hypothetical protein
LSTDQTAIPDYSNLNIKDTEKLKRYKDLEAEVSRMWKVRPKIVPVTIGALGTIKKRLIRSEPSAAPQSQVSRP